MVVLIVYLTKVNDNEVRTIGVLNESNYFSTDFQGTESTSFVRLKDIDLEAAKDSVQNMGFYGLLYIPKRIGTWKRWLVGPSFILKEPPGTNVLDNLENVFEDRLRLRRLQELGVSVSDFESVDNNFQINTATYSGESEPERYNRIKAL